mgnify:CR=1 FL=1
MALWCAPYKRKSPEYNPRDARSTTLIFSHPDYTVGSGISPESACARGLTAPGRITAGRESHPALKIVFTIQFRHYITTAALSKSRQSRDICGWKQPAANTHIQQNHMLKRDCRLTDAEAQFVNDRNFDMQEADSFEYVWTIHFSKVLGPDPGDLAFCRADRKSSVECRTRTNRQEPNS